MLIMWEIIIRLIQSEYIRIAVICVLSYLIGCLNFSIIVTKTLGGKGDIRGMGSGNAGFTNTLRSVGAKPAAVTFAGDFLKGVLAVFIGKYIMSFASAPIELYGENGSVLLVQAGAYIASFMCLIGHIYPCFYGFRGGKGILTTWSTILLIDWRIFLIVITIFLIVLAASRIVSVSSITAAASYPITTFLVTYFLTDMKNDRIGYTLFCVLISLAAASIVIFKHKSNIYRLLQGTEKKIAAKKS